LTAGTVTGQVTILKPVRDAFDIGPGTGAGFVADRDGEFILRKSEHRPDPHPFDRLLGILGPGMSTDDLMALTRGDD
jgi:bifunctional DNA-binding transcriptional regulator/antitoxin component of YhaV-PrlF toxin-antitoxin module